MQSVGLDHGTCSACRLDIGEGDLPGGGYASLGISPRARVSAVERVARLFRSFEAADEADDEFYANLTPDARLDLLLELVDRHRSSLGEAASRFERVHRIVELSRC